MSLVTCFMLVSCLFYSSTLKMEATGSSVTSTDFQLIIRRFIPEDGTLRLYNFLFRTGGEGQLASGAINGVDFP
jgi:hypothetical protein